MRWKVCWSGDEMKWMQWNVINIIKPRVMQIERSLEWERTAERMERMLAVVQTSSSSSAHPGKRIRKSENCCLAVQHGNNLNLWRCASSMLLLSSIRFCQVKHWFNLIAAYRFDGFLHCQVDTQHSAFFSLYLHTFHLHTLYQSLPLSVY